MLNKNPHEVLIRKEAREQKEPAKRENEPLDLKPNDWFPLSNQAFFFIPGTALALFNPAKIWGR